MACMSYAFADGKLTIGPAYPVQLNPDEDLSE